MQKSKLEKHELRQLLEAKNSEGLRKRFSQTDPADAADLMEELDPEDIERVFSSLDDETASDVIVEMEPENIDEVMEKLPPEKIARIVSEMAPDDATDFLRELDPEEQKSVWDLLNGEIKEELKSLLGYDDDSAGGIMTPELCAVNGTATVQQAIDALGKEEFSDPIFVIFVIDDERKLSGCVNISTLITKPRNVLIKDIATPVPIVAAVDDDQEKIANNFRKYDLHVMPVVDKDNRLIGRITADDVMDVMHEEASEDLARMAGAPDIEQNEDSPFKIVKLRLPWLMITLISGMLVSLIVNKIISLNSAIGLAAFVPAILGMGGNTGIQASIVTIRSIALGEIGFNKLFKVLFREIFVGFIMGLVCGIIIGLTVFTAISVFHTGGDMGHSPLRLSFIVGGSMCTAMTFAAVSGSMFPIFLNQLKIDPAVASGPFISTGNDLSASLIYMLMCYILLSI
ncbi:MAG: magnesium transporter [Lentisphaerae bacterium GWF2_45_14]|nr:MAG: magnesium transporter [Lentisphaerae bacterium GWF2_45_14]